MADNNPGIVPGEYMPRIADAQIDTSLKLFGAVEVSGTKWCEKPGPLLPTHAVLPTSNIKEPQGRQVLLLQLQEQ